MKKLSLLFLFLILAASVTPAIPARSDVTLSGFKIMQVYWGTDQPMEVSSGDVETLTVVMRYELGYSFTNLKADLSLSGGFKAVGGGSTVTTYYAGSVSLGSIVKLSFPVSISAGVEKGRYTADLKLEYVYVTAPAKEELTITFDVTGKPHIDVLVLNDTFYEGKQRISIALSNDGDAIAKNLKVVSVDSSSASVELGKTGFVDLAPEESVAVPLSLSIPAGMENKLLRLDVQVSCLGPNNVAYVFSKTLQLLVQPLSESTMFCQYPLKSAAPGGTVRFQARLKNTLGVETRFKMSFDSIPPSWTASVKTASGEYMTGVILDSDESVDFVVEVKSPDSAETGGEYQLLVKAESYDGSTVSSLPLTVAISEETAVELYSSILSLVASPGDKLTLPFVVSNNGEGSETAEFLISEPEGWSTRILDQAGHEVTKAELSPSTSLNLELEVTIPTTSAGDNYLTLTTAGKANSTLDYVIEVRPSSESLMFCQFPWKSAAPGDTVQFQARLKNPFGVETQFKISVDSIPAGWTASVKSVTGEYARELTLDNKESADFMVEVELPDSAKMGEEYGLLVKAESYDGNTVGSLRLNIAVKEVEEEVQIATKFPGRSVAPGGTAQFDLTVKNPFSVETRFKISVDSIPPDWTASVKTASGDYVTEATLGSNELVDLVVEVESPDSARIGEEHELLVKVESRDGNAVGSLPLTIAIKETKEETRITAKFPDVAVEAGKVVQYPVTITNLGYVDKLLLLSVEPPAGWKAVFKSGVLEVSRLYMEAGESEDLIVEVTPPSTVSVGAYTIPVQVKSETGAVYTEMELKASIVGSYALGLDLSTLLTSVATGGSTTFTAKITNTGYTSVTGISLNIQAPTGWESSITPTQVDSLKPKESYTFSVVLKTTEDTVAGDYLVTLTGLSDQVKSDAVQVRITAAAPTSWGLIGVGIAVVMIVALLFVFMKFRRR